MLVIRGLHLAFSGGFELYLIDDEDGFTSVSELTQFTINIQIDENASSVEESLLKRVLEYMKAKLHLEEESIDDLQLAVSCMRFVDQKKNNDIVY